MERLESLVDMGEADAPLLVLLHGRGSDERDLFPLGRLLHDTATVVSVRAPFDAAPWGYGPGFAWYRFLGGTTPEADSFIKGQDALASFLDALPKRLSRPDVPLILGGFSQGGTSALAYAVRNPHRANAVLVFSGFLADHPTALVSPDSVGKTPIFWGHGTADFAVPFEAATAGWAALRAASAPLTAHTYEGMSHTISERELVDARQWLDGVFSLPHQP